MAFTNRDRLRRKMKSIPVGVRKALKAQNAANAEELVQTIKGFAPVASGALRDSVRAQDVSDSTRISHRVSMGGSRTTKAIGTRTYDSAVRIGSGDTAGRKKLAGGENVTYDYALAQEFGTSDHEANPSFWPAWRLKRRRFKSRMSRRAKKAIAEAVK